MPRLLYLAALLFLYSSQACAQMYWPVTHASGTQLVGNYPVTVTRVGLDSMWQLNGTMSCPVIGPYEISAQNGTDTACGYRFSFTNPVDTIRIRLHLVNWGEMIGIKINGVPYNITPANLAAVTICPTAGTGAIGVVNGRVTCVAGSSSAYADAEINIATSYNIDSVDILDNSTSSSTLVYFAFLNNSCAQDLDAQANSPCIGNALFLNSLAIPGAVYSWTGPGGYTAAVRGPVRASVPANAGGDYIVTASFGNGCFAADTVHVVIRALPATPVATSNSPVCLGDTIFLSAAGSAAGALYVWSGPDNFSAPQQDTFITPATVANAGNYLVFAVDSGCLSAPVGTHVSINTDTLTPDVHITASPGTVILAGTPVSFTATSNLGTGAAWQWRKNGQPVIGATNSTWTSATLVNGDVVDVIASSSKPCVQPNADTSNGLVITIQSGIGTVAGSCAVTLSPNPNNGDFNLLGKIPSGPARVAVTDAFGRMIWSHVYTVQQDQLHVRLHLATALPGVYYLRITSAAGSATTVFTIR